MIANPPASTQERLAAIQKTGVPGIHEARRADGTSDFRECRLFLDGRNGDCAIQSVIRHSAPGQCAGPSRSLVAKAVCEPQEPHYQEWVRTQKATGSYPAFLAFFACSLIDRKQAASCCW